MSNKIRNKKRDDIEKSKNLPYILHESSPPFPKTFIFTIGKLIKGGVKRPRCKKISKKTRSGDI